MQRLLVEELAKAKGVPSNWNLASRQVNCMIDELTLLHVWAAAGDTIREAWNPGPVTPHREDCMPTTLPVAWLEDQTDDDDDEGAGEWEWNPPDLSEGGEWHKA